MKTMTSSMMCTLVYLLAEIPNINSAIYFGNEVKSILSLMPALKGWHFYLGVIFPADSTPSPNAAPYSASQKDRYLAWYCKYEEKPVILNFVDQPKYGSILGFLKDWGYGPRK